VLSPWRLVVRLVWLVLLVPLSLFLICAGLSKPDIWGHLLALQGCLGLAGVLSWGWRFVQWLTGSRSRFLNQFVRDVLDAHSVRGQ
jgi:hypothetical protein